MRSKESKWNETNIEPIVRTRGRSLHVAGIKLKASNIPGWRKHCFLFFFKAQTPIVLQPERDRKPEGEDHRSPTSHTLLPGTSSSLSSPPSTSVNVTRVHGFFFILCVCVFISQKDCKKNELGTIMWTRDNIAGVSWSHENTPAC